MEKAGHFWEGCFAAGNERRGGGGNTMPTFGSASILTDGKNLFWPHPSFFPLSLLRGRGQSSSRCTGHGGNSPIRYVDNEYKQKMKDHYNRAPTPCCAWITHIFDFNVFEQNSYIPIPQLIRLAILASRIKKIPLPIMPYPSEVGSYRPSLLKNSGHKGGFGFLMQIPANQIRFIGSEVQGSGGFWVFVSAFSQPVRSPFWEEVPVSIYSEGFLTIGVFFSSLLSTYENIWTNVELIGEANWSKGSDNCAE